MVGGQVLAVDAHRVLGDLLELGAEPDVDADALGRVLHVGGHVLVEGGHDLPGALDERHAQAALHERLGHLEADVAAADHDRALAAALQRGPEALGGVDGARRLGRVGARDVGRDGLGAGGEDDLVEALGALVAALVAHGEHATIEVDRRDRGARVDLDPASRDARRASA